MIRVHRTGYFSVAPPTCQTKKTLCGCSRIRSEEWATRSFVQKRRGIPNTQGGGGAGAKRDDQKFEPRGWQADKPKKRTHIQADFFDFFWFSVFGFRRDAMQSQGSLSLTLTHPHDRLAEPAVLLRAPLDRLVALQPGVVLSPSASKWLGILHQRLFLLKVRLLGCLLLRIRSPRSWRAPAGLLLQLLLLLRWKWRREPHELGLAPSVVLRVLPRGAVLLVGQRFLLGVGRFVGRAFVCWLVGTGSNVPNAHGRIGVAGAADAAVVGAGWLAPEQLRRVSPADGLRSKYYVAGGQTHVRGARHAFLS